MVRRNSAVRLLSNSSAVFDDQRFTIHHQAMRKPQWFAEFDWSALPDVAPEMHDFAWYLCSSSSYAEQTGMIGAIQLMLDAPDTATRLCFATAVQDEATHSEAFARYAIALKGEVAAPIEHFSNLHAENTKFDLSYSERLTIHTMLEGWATDEFAILADIFSNTSLGTLYLHVSRDEGRHVRLGLATIAYLRKEGLIPKAPSLRKLEQRAYELSGLDLATYQGLAKHAGLSAEEVKSWFERRQAARMKRLADVL